MPFAAALSMHPVPAYATGEVIGQLAEDLGVRPDLLVVVARPGLAGALEDIAATIRRLLDPGVLIGGIANGVGTGTAFTDGGPAVALWGASGGAVEPWRPTETVGSRHGPYASGGDQGGRPAASVALVLTAGGPGPPLPWASYAAGRRQSGDLIAGEPGLAVVGGVIRGPLVLDGDIVATGSVGVRLGIGLAPRIAAVSDLGPIGPRLVVTAAVGASILELDGQPALDRLTAVVRDHVPAGVLSRIGDELFIGELPEATVAPAPARVLGADRRNGAVVVAEGAKALEVGDAVMVHVAAPDNVDRALRAALGVVGEAEGVLLFAAPGHGRPAGAGISGLAAGLDELESHWTLLPAATLSIEAAPAYCGRRADTTETERASAVALFS